MGVRPPLRFGSHASLTNLSWKSASATACLTPLTSTVTGIRHHLLGCAMPVEHRVPSPGPECALAAACAFLSFRYFGHIGTYGRRSGLPVIDPLSVYRMELSGMPGSGGAVPRRVSRGRVVAPPRTVVMRPFGVLPERTGMGLRK